MTRATSLQHQSKSALLDSQCHSRRSRTVRSGIQSGVQARSVSLDSRSDLLSAGNDTRRKPVAAEIRSTSVGRLRGEGRQPRADRLKKKLVRLCRDVLHRGRVGQHGAGAADDLVYARDMRQVQFAEDLEGREGLDLAKPLMEFGEAALAENGGGGLRDSLGVEAVGDLERGATDNPGPEPVSVVHDFGGRTLQFPHDSQTLEQLQKIEGRVVFPPAEALADAALERMMVVVPALPHGDNGEEPVVAGIVAGDVAPAADD